MQYFLPVISESEAHVNSVIHSKPLFFVMLMNMIYR